MANLASRLAAWQAHGWRIIFVTRIAYFARNARYHSTRSWRLHRREHNINITRTARQRACNNVIIHSLFDGARVSHNAASARNIQDDAMFVDNSMAHQHRTISAPALYSAT